MELKDPAELPDGGFDGFGIHYMELKDVMDSPGACTGCWLTPGRIHYMELKDSCSKDFEVVYVVNPLHGVES